MANEPGNASTRPGSAMSFGLATPQTVSDDQSNGVAVTGHEEPEIGQKENDGVYVAQAPSHEYFGPTSFLSLCSKPGIDWVNSKSTSENFEPVAVSLMTGMARRLKIEGTLPPVRATEPEASTAWKYFSNSPEAAFGIVNQTWFNARLQAHFDHARDDSAWYALRNALLAAGCRIYLSRSAGFREAKRASWALFENAMACLPNLLLYSSSVIGVQALTLMVSHLRSFSESDSIDWTSLGIFLGRPFKPVTTVHVNIQRNATGLLHGNASAKCTVMEDASQ
ncbi:hypothetical protein PRZ48_010025 [Zasmidium cellare]|uniref:Uncharacterized protein n=1 Tax=Zasmidium cellare TaxID=395010 RepID=A0ABR0EDZ0_ZASCE|nr:hypothetical protein PRZ48_010025 [Zasmidium cellare]